MAAAEKRKAQDIAKQVASAKPKKKLSDAEKRKVIASQTVHNDYIKKMGAAAVAAAKVKSDSKKKQSAKKREAVVKSCKLKVGMRVTAKWVDDDDDADDANDDCYYDGVVVSINYDNKTANILFDDGDTDDAVPWGDTRIQEDLSEDEDDG